jgi:ornithine cyclodeaminase/alanine dehydrogenase-like protein (mu-crystallin family)
MTTFTDAGAGAIHVLSKQDLAGLRYSLDEVLSAVEGAYQGFAAGLSANPRKLTVKPEDAHSLSYSMLGRDGERQTVAFKTSYKFNANEELSLQKYYTSLQLYDDVTGLPIALMDCSLVGALRTPAASALLARSCARSDAQTALVVGSGVQGQNALPFLVAALPQLQRLIVYGNHHAGIDAVITRMHQHYPERRIEVATSLEQAARAADIIIGAAGPASEKSSGAVRRDWLKPGALTILVGYGLHAELLHTADRRIATSAAQMLVTGTDLADAQGLLPAVDAELPDILAGKKAGRISNAQHVFAYNSGMIITDIALGRLFAERARAQQLGLMIRLW